ncbi:MAG: hypothetical protein J1E38_09240 [Paramuribaculum sp.]|nr:hypothetical protein [Paramuribaculum sp.]
MKQKVRISLYSIIVTIVAISLYVFVIVKCFEKGEMLPFWIVTSAMILLVVSMLIYMPVSVKANDEALKVRRPLKSKVIPISEIEMIERITPTMNERRLLGSGGWFGYWGWFSERDLGKYFAYYGKSSECFFIRLKNGRQYMLGCNNPDMMVEHLKEIKSSIS